jgi:FlaA1/EpsC-like NDP-sugar epimerase
LAAELFAGVLLAFGLYNLQDRGELRLHLFTIVVYAVLLIPALIILRSLWRITNDMIYWLRPGEDRDGIPAKRILVIGAGKECILFLRSYSSGKRFDGGLAKVIGILDDDSNLHRRYVHGVKVYGGLDTLRDIIHKEKIDQVVITADLDSLKNAELIATAKDENVSVVRFRTVVDNLIGQSV